MISPVEKKLETHKLIAVAAVLVFVLACAAFWLWPEDTGPQSSAEPTAGVEIIDKTFPEPESSQFQYQRN